MNLLRLWQFDRAWRLTGNLRRHLNSTLDLVFPPACVLCQAPLETDDRIHLCEQCRGDVVDRRSACDRCGGAAPPATTGANCPHCHGARLHFDAVVRLGRYEGLLRTAVLRMKTEKNPGQAIALGDWIFARHGERLRAMNVDAVVPVPMHWSRRIRRGVNSPQLVAERLATHLQVPLAAHLLVRQRRTAIQARLPASRRRANVRNAFRVRPHADLPGARLLLVDDVMTTGATVNEAAKVLKKAGAEAISIAVLARAEGLD
jgi:ComF family protein